ncbi:trypsin-like serine protease [Octadecabacter sp.]|nr:trypsin-like serine protease [Octadecabacter sp.]
MLRSLLILLTFLVALPAHAQDSCEYANDNECDEARYGEQGYCDDGTDTTDCRLLSAGITDNSCEFANDGECDEYRYNSTGACVDGSDTNDCAIWQTQRESEFMERAQALNLPVLTIGRLGNNTCRWSNDGECDDPDIGGSGACNPGTDATDCIQNFDTSAELAPALGGGGQCVDRSDATDCDMFGTSPEALARFLALVPDPLRASLGDDTCEYSNDGECDDANFGGTIYCTPGTDATDCRAMALGGEDSCRWANDNECDEPGIGTDNCTSGTDVTDCSAVAYLRNRTDTCNSAFDGICNEVENGNGTCEAFSDTADCLGRSRPVGLENHFFGRDDRILVDATQMPWAAIGSIELQSGTCTGTLVGPSLVLTAAHCVTDTGDETLTPVSFSAGLSLGRSMGTAKVTGAVFDPAYDPETQPAGGGNGHDWALIVLDKPLGDSVGFLDIHELTSDELSAIGRAGLIVNQAGYSWDTGNNMSGNVGCRIVEAFEDNSILHECDTAQGDSGSPFLLNIDGDWKIIAVDSQFFSATDDKTPFSQSNLAVDSRAFAAAVAQQQ